MTSVYIFIISSWINMNNIELHLHLRLDRRQKSKNNVWAITSQREQYGVTVHLFIGTVRSLGKITFMSLTFTISQKVSCRGLNSLFSFRSVSFSITVLVLSRSFFIHSFRTGSSFFQIAPFIPCTPSSQSRSFPWQYITLESMLVVFLRTFRRRRPPIVAPRSINLFLYLTNSDCDVNKGL